MGTYPAPVIPQFAGYPAVADFTRWITSPLGFCTFGVLLRAEQHAQQSLTGGVQAVLQYGTLLEDPYSGWNPANWRFTPPYSGWYEVTVGANIVGTAGNPSLQALASISGTNFELALTPTYSGNTGGQCGQGYFYLAGGTDYVSGVIASSITTTTDCTTAGRFPFLEVSFAAT